MTAGRGVVVAALLALTVSACGTTVQQPLGSGSPAGGLQPAGPGLVGSPATAGTGSDPLASGTSPEPALSRDTATGSDAAGDASVGATTGALSAGGTGNAAATARGLTATQINIGVVTTQDAATLGKSLGAENLVGGDHVAEIDALLKHLNAHGGIAGRRVVAVYQDVRTSDATSDPSSAAQAACDGLTQDKQVFAVISIVGNLNNDVMYQCMAKHHTPFFGVDLVPHHASAFAKYAPDVYGAHTLVLERLLPTLADRLRALSWFSGWNTATGGPASTPARVGVLYFDVDPGFRQLATKALAKVGYQVSDSFGYKDDLSTLSSQMQSAVLQFRQHGITHVVIEESDGVLFFLPAAEDQGYRPRYGFTSLDAAKALSDTGTVPARQFVGMRGVGWAPELDVGNRPTESSGAAACRTVMKDAGIDTSDSTAFFYMAVECDAFLLLKAGLERQRSFTPAGLREGLEALGTGFDAAAVTGIAWHPGSYDGVSALLDFGYDNGTFTYRGSPHPT
jgi:ABC-type branched-subunit amino acid transport system substrate-binding protein